MSAETKTIREWLETLPDPEKEKALDNLNAEFDNIKAETLSEALALGFDWDTTPEEADYWGAIWKSAYDASAGHARKEGG